MIPQEAIEAAANAISECSGMRFDGFWSRIEDLESEDREYALTEAQAALEAAAPFLRAQALTDAADELVWVRPEKSPCGSFEACCGSEASCDAMNPSASAVGETWLRARAATERGQG